MTILVLARQVHISTFRSLVLYFSIVVGGGAESCSHQSPEAETLVESSRQSTY